MRRNHDFPEGDAYSASALYLSIFDREPLHSNAELRHAITETVTTRGQAVGLLDAQSIQGNPHGHSVAMGRHRGDIADRLGME